VQNSARACGCRVKREQILLGSNTWCCSEVESNLAKAKLKNNYAFCNVAVKLCEILK
jgi:hypothetical protein